jgi:hypothetical protein
MKASSNTEKKFGHFSSALIFFVFLGKVAEITKSPIPLNVRGMSKQ